MVNDGLDIYGDTDMQVKQIFCVFQVYFLLPIYLRLGGSLCTCLRRWLEADELQPDDESWWNPPNPIRQKLASTEDFEIKDDPVSDFLAI